MMRKKNISILIPDNKGQSLLVDYFFTVNPEGVLEKKRFHWKREKELNNFALI